MNNFALNYNVCVPCQSPSRLSKYMLKCESIETIKTRTIYLITGYEDDCKIIYPRDRNYFPRRSRGKKLLSRGPINSLSFKYPVNRCFVIPRFLSHYIWKWISGSILFPNLGEVWNLEYLAVHVHLRMDTGNWMYGNVLVLVQFQVLHTLCYKFRFVFSPQPFGV